MKRILMTQALPGALVAATFATACLAATGMDSAAAQESQLEPGKIVTVAIGAPKPDMRQAEYQLSSRVSAADLDLTTRAGTKELENRIRDTANSVCDQLLDADPPPTALSRVADQSNCVYDATQGAMTQARMLISMAELAKKTRG
jgi:UrcA family protein